MKYKDQTLSINAEAITIYDTDRPTQGLIELFNPSANKLTAQSVGIICRVNGIVHELSENIAFGINDIKLHCIMPILIYARDEKYKDTFFSVSNKLVINQSKLAKDLLVSVEPNFFNNSLDLVDSIYEQENFTYLIFNIEDKSSILTAIDKLSNRRGAITIHNPYYKNTTDFMRYCLEKNIHLIENVSFTV